MVHTGSSESGIQPRRRLRCPNPGGRDQAKASAVVGLHRRVGFEELGSWLWLIGLFVLVIRSVVDTKLPESLLTWAWMLGMLGMWTLEVTMLGDIGGEANIASSDPVFLEQMARQIASGNFAAAAETRRVAELLDVMAAGLVFGMVGWVLGVGEALIGGVGLGVAFGIRRRLLASEGDDPDPRPALEPRERWAHVVLVRARG